MSVRAPVGATNIANNDCCIGRGLAALNSKVSSITHLYYIIDGLKTAFDQRNAAGTTFGSITKDDLFALPVVVPNTAVLLSFEKVCSAFFEKQIIIGEEIDLLTKQRDSLLPLLMNGQVSLNYDLSNNLPMQQPRLAAHFPLTSKSSPSPACRGKHKRVYDPEHKRVCDPLTSRIV